MDCAMIIPDLWEDEIIMKFQDQTYGKAFRY